MVVDKFVDAWAGHREVLGNASDIPDRPKSRSRENESDLFNAHYERAERYAGAAARSGAMSTWVMPPASDARLSHQRLLRVRSFTGQPHVR